MYTVSTVQSAAVGWRFDFSAIEVPFNSESAPVIDLGASQLESAMHERGSRVVPGL